MDQRRINTTSIELVPPILVGLILLVSLIGVLSALSSITGWSTNYGETGVFENDRCESESLRITDRVTCSGLLTPSESTTTVPATMIGPQAAFGSNPPVGGEQVPVYFRSGVTSEVYPEEGRTTELIRLLLGHLDVLFLLVGSTSWLLGWYLTREISEEDAEYRQHRYRLPQRFGMKSIGVKWLLVGFGWWLIDRMVLDGLLGTVGLG